MAIDLVAVAESAGVVGAGGAGFPTHVKLSTKADIVIINGAECEPLLRVDQQLMTKYPDKLLKALDIMVRHVGAKRGVIALKTHYHDAKDALEKLLPNYPKLSLFLMGGFYPAGDEQVIVTEVTGRIVPEGGIPIQVGVVVSNVETALNLYSAYADGTPVIYTYLTLTGEVKSPKTVKVPLGITVKEALNLAGGVTVPNYRVINGGTMMGKIVNDESLITKTTKGLIVLPENHPLITSLNLPLERSIKDAAIACMQCSMCTEVCPRANLGHRIHPHKIMRMASYGSLCDENDTPMNAFLCCGCRLCEYACVMNLQPWKLNNSFKNALAKNGIKNTLSNAPEETHPFREIKRYPVKKLILQLGLDKYDVDAPMEELTCSTHQVVIPLRQNVGSPAEPIVSIGERVEPGSRIAQIPKGKLGANLHASIGGTISEITDEAIVIKV